MLIIKSIRILPEGREDWGPHLQVTDWWAEVWGGGSVPQGLSEGNQAPALQPVPVSGWPAEGGAGPALGNSTGRLHFGPTLSWLTSWLKLTQESHRISTATHTLCDSVGILMNCRGIPAHRLQQVKTFCGRLSTWGVELCKENPLSFEKDSLFLFQRAAVVLFQL